MRLSHVAWLSSATLANVALADFTYPDFASTAGLRLVGSAAQSGADLRLTPAMGQNTGGAWSEDRQPIAGGFDTTFSFRLSDAGPVDGADGLAFVVQDFSADALGGVGRDMGYGLISRSLAVEIDTFINLDLGDPDSDHLGVLSRGVLPNSPDHAIAGMGLSSVPGDLYDGMARTLRVRYLPGMLDVFYDGSATPAISVAVDLPSLIGSVDGRAYVGFTSATGAAWGNHDLNSWSFQAVPGPGTSGIIAALALFGGVHRRRR